MKSAENNEHTIIGNILVIAYGITMKNVRMF